MTLAAAGDFKQFVDGLAAQLVSHSPTFEAFVAAMPGVLPDEALASLRRITGPDAERLEKDAANDHAGPVIDQCALLPLPHPLDSEFRFDATTATILATALVESTRDGDEILLIGVPSVALEIAAMRPNRTVRFLGPDNCVTSAVRSAFDGSRLFLDQGLGGTAAAALLDPPWYQRPMAELIRVCATGCRKGALVKLIMPPEGARPEIARDRSLFLSEASNAGMSPTGIDGPVCYRTPLFELAAMERQGIARLPSWRRGEVVEFVTDGSSKPEKWLAPHPTELSIAGVRLHLVEGEPGGGATLIPIDEHAVFPSVSARAPGRSRATLWTTTNRAFSIDRNIVHAALGRLATMPELLHFGINTPENESLSQPCVDAADELIHQLTELIGQEIDDARRLVGDGAWLRTEMEWRC